MPSLLTPAYTGLHLVIILSILGQILVARCNNITNSIEYSESRGGSRASSICSFGNFSWCAERYFDPRFWKRKMHCRWQQNNLFVHSSSFIDSFISSLLAANAVHCKGIQSISWSRNDGNKIATSCKNNSVRVLDLIDFAKSGLEAQSHKNIRDSRILWLNDDNLIISTGKIVFILSVCESSILIFRIE